MSQKELNYLEDIYNHELLMINIISKSMEEVSNDDYCSLLEDQLSNHENLNKKILKLLEAHK
ncbi:MAG: hypothetical protein K2I70_03820 [Bacilli bacterium]|nr:hypothetical protein [Bacilli bacterium]